MLPTPIAAAIVAVTVSFSGSCGGPSAHYERLGFKFDRPASFRPAPVSWGVSAGNAVTNDSFVLDQANVIGVDTYALPPSINTANVAGLRPQIVRLTKGVRLLSHGVVTTPLHRTAWGGAQGYEEVTVTDGPPGTRVEATRVLLFAGQRELVIVCQAYGANAGRTHLACNQLLRSIQST